MNSDLDRVRGKDVGQPEIAQVDAKSFFVTETDLILIVTLVVSINDDK